MDDIQLDNKCHGCETLNPSDAKKCKECKLDLPGNASKRTPFMNKEEHILQLEAEPVDKAKADKTINASKETEENETSNGCAAGEENKEIDEEEKTPFEECFEVLLNFWRHPWCRLFCVTALVTFNFLLYAEDPMAHSRKETSIPIAGSGYQFLFLYWPRQWYWIILRLFLIFCGLTTGPLFGYFAIHHWFLRDYLNLSMFQQFKGTWFCMFIFTMFWGIVFTNLWNFIVPPEHDVDDMLGFDEYLFGQMAAFGCWFGDAITWFMCLDSMLQNNELYTDWVPWARELWKGNTRIYGVWIPVALGTLTVGLLVWVDNNIWGDYVGSTVSSEFGRAMIGATIFALDLLIVAQEWDFPNFDTGVGFDVKIVGLEVTSIDFSPEWLSEYFHFEITGTWMNYTPMFLTMGLDCACYYSLIFYVPADFAQYVGPDDSIWNIADKSQANDPNTILDYDYRQVQNNFAGDEKLAAKYRDHPNSYMIFTFIPIFLSLIWFFMTYTYLHQHEKPGEQKIDHSSFTVDLKKKEKEEEVTTNTKSTVDISDEEDIELGEIEHNSSEYVNGTEGEFEGGEENLVLAGDFTVLLNKSN